MLRRSTELVRAAGEAVGILSPNIADATAAAEQRQKNLVAAQAAIDAAEAALITLHDIGADEKQITSAEAALADARVNTERAQRAYLAAEKRLIAARSAESNKAKGEARERLNQALAIREKAAAEIDRLAVAMGGQKNLLAAQDSVIAEAISIGVAPREGTYTIGRAQRCAELALSKYGAVPRAYMGDITQHPSAGDVISRDNAALAAA